MMRTKTPLHSRERAAIVLMTCAIRVIQNYKDEILIQFQMIIIKYALDVSMTYDSIHPSDSLVFL